MSEGNRAEMRRDLLRRAAVLLDEPNTDQHDRCVWCQAEFFSNEDYDAHTPDCPVATWQRDYRQWYQRARLTRPMVNR